MVSLLCHKSLKAESFFLDLYTAILQRVAKPVKFLNVLCDHNSVMVIS